MNIEDRSIYTICEEINVENIPKIKSNTSMGILAGGSVIEYSEWCNFSKAEEFYSYMIELHTKIDDVFSSNYYINCLYIDDQYVADDIHDMIRSSGKRQSYLIRDLPKFIGTYLILTKYKVRYVNFEPNWDYEFYVYSIGYIRKQIDFLNLELGNAMNLFNGNSGE